MMKYYEQVNLLIQRYRPFVSINKNGLWIKENLMMDIELFLPMKLKIIF